MCGGLSIYHIRYILSRGFFRFFIALAQNLTLFTLELARLTSAQLIYQIHPEMSTPFFEFSLVFLKFFAGNNIYGFSALTPHKICVLPPHFPPSIGEPQSRRQEKSQNQASKKDPAFFLRKALAEQRKNGAEGHAPPCRPHSGQRSHRRKA